MFTNGPTAFFVYGIIACLVDLLWRLTTNRWPTYKRHLAIFSLFGLFIAARSFYLWYASGLTGETGDWLTKAIGVFMGLCISNVPFLFGSRNPIHGWVLGSNARPDASRRLVIVADPHWSEELTGLQQATLAMPDADWLFLGDVFEVWLGVRSFQTDAQRNFIWWVHERRRTGHWVGLWLGNREYFLDSLAYRFDYMGEGIGGALKDEPIAFEHGDLINTEDRLYRLWNLISRSWLVWLLAKMIPSYFGKKLALAMEKALQKTNKGYKLEFPRDEFQKSAYACGSPTLITGHFHTHEVTEHGFSVPWASNGKFLLWQSGEFTPVDYNPNRKHQWGNAPLEEEEVEAGEGEAASGTEAGNQEPGVRGQGTSEIGQGIAGSSDGSANTPALS